MNIKSCGRCNISDDITLEDTFMHQYGEMWLCDLCAEALADGQDVWFLFDEEDDEEPSHEANIYLDDESVRVEWCNTSVGLVSTRYFDTYDGARQWLTDGGYTDFTA